MLKVLKKIDDLISVMLSLNYQEKIEISNTIEQVETIEAHKFSLLK